MSRSAPRYLFATLSTALLGAAVSGGCALVFNFDYSSGGAGGGSSSASGHPSSGSTSSGNNSSSGMSSSSGCSMDGGEGGAAGGGGPPPKWQISLGGTGLDRAGHPGIDIGPNGEIFITGVFTGGIDLPNKPLMKTGTNSFLARLKTNATEDGVDGLWSTVLADSTDTVSSLVATSDGVIVAGSLQSSLAFSCASMTGSPGGGHDIFLAKFDLAGACQWVDVYGDAGDQYANAVEVDPAGNIYLTGSAKGGFKTGNCDVSGSSSNETAFVAQFDQSGVCKWATAFGEDAQGLSLAAIGAPPATTKGIAVGGMFNGMITFPNFVISTMSRAPYVATFDPTGAPIDVKNFTGTNINLVEENAYNSDALFGITSFGGLGKGIGVGMIDQNAKILSPTQVSGTAAATLESITRQPMGGVFLSGEYACGNLTLGSSIPNHGAQDAFVAHLDTAFKPVSGAGYGDTANQFARNVRFGENGSMYLFGEFEGEINLGSGKLASKGASDILLAMFKDPNIP